MGCAEAFVVGAVSPEEAVHTMRPCGEQAESLSLLARESGLEALLSEQYRVPHSRGSSAGIPELSEQMSEQDWSTLIDTAIARGFDEGLVRFPGRRVRPGRPRKWRLAIAAAIAGLIAGGVHVGLRLGTDGRTPPPEVARVQEAEKVDAGGEDGSDTARAAPEVALPEKPVKEFRIEGPRSPNVTIPSSRLGAVHLGGLSGIFVEEEARLAVDRSSDSSVVVRMNTGKALFAVEHRRFVSFEVRTPHAGVRVVGTVFRVSVDTSFTSVSVLEGRVMVTSPDGVRVALQPNTACSMASVCVDSIACTAAPEEPRLAARSGLLRSYLRYMQGEGGVVVPKLSPRPRLDTLERYAASIPPGTPLRRAEPRLLYGTARRLEDSGRPRQAGDLYRRLVANGSGDTLEYLAGYRLARMHLETYKQPEEAVSLLTDLLAQGSGEPLARELSALLIRALFETSDYGKVAVRMQEHVERWPSSEGTERIAYACAQVLRIHIEDFEQALHYYALVADSFPDSPRREDALYWAGWCLAQHGAQRFENRFLGTYDSSYPEGNWRMSERAR